MAIADVLSVEQLKMMAVLKIIQDKGLITEEEMKAAMDSVSSTPPELTAEIADSILNRLKARTIIRFQEMALLSGKTGPAQ